MSDAMRRMEKVKTPKGFMVSFEWKRGGMLHGDYFPDKHQGEALIKTEDEAWDLAHNFAKSTKGETVNLYVVDASFSPVDGYSSRIITNR